MSNISFSDDFNLHKATDEAVNSKDNSSNEIPEEHKEPIYTVEELFRELDRITREMEAVYKHSPKKSTGDALVGLNQAIDCLS